ncbi:MAG: short-subunit dehydrogenase [Chlamydiales bacterium]|jgi:short-subunit dehydrogenase
MRVKNSVIVVTGASSGFGEAIARNAAKRGATVVLLARSTNALEKIAAEINAEEKGRAHFFSVDLSKESEILSVSTKIKSQIGIPDALVNNAGIGNWLSLQETPIEDISNMLRVPLLAAMLITKVFLDDMVNDEKPKSIINISTPAAYLKIPGACCYAVARAGIKAFHDQLQLELRNTEVKTSLIIPGEANTPYFSNNPISKERIPRLGSLTRILEPEEVAKTVVDTIENGRKEVIFPFVLKAFIRLNQICSLFIQPLITYVLAWKPPTKEQRIAAKKAEELKIE